MAENRKYKLGDYEFNTEQEYREAAIDLKRIKELMAKYDISRPEQAKRILTTIQAHPETFRSPYGRKFVEKLEKAAGKADQTTRNTAAVRTPAGSGAGSPANTTSGSSISPPSPEQTGTKKTKSRKPKLKKDGSTAKSNIQIFTMRNFVIGIIIIAGIVVFSLYGAKLFSFNNDSAGGNGDIKRTMITSYAKNQAELKARLYTYYFNVAGQPEDEAKNQAEKDIGNYALDLSERSVSGMSDSEIADVFKQLEEGGDIKNNSFVEPAAITVLKEKLFEAGISGNSSNGSDGETAMAAALNNMMLYQERMYYSLCHNYELLAFESEDSKAFAMDDMTAMFGEIIFDKDLSEEDKEGSFELFQKRGLIKDNQIVRFSTDPTASNLPELTPAIEISINKEAAKAYRCSMISYAPAASVFYEFHSDNESGYLCFRNNGTNTKYVQLDKDTTVTVQGDFFMVSGSDITRGEWFYHKQSIGLLLDGSQDSLISYVYDLTH